MWHFSLKEFYILQSNMLDAYIATTARDFDHMSSQMAIIKVGDRFLNTEGTGERIEVTGIFPSGDTYEVKGDKSPLYYRINSAALTSPRWAILTNDGSPVWMKHPPLLEPVDKKCDCGLKFSRDGGNHSPWCSLEAKK